MRPVIFILFWIPVLGLHSLVPLPYPGDRMDLTTWVTIQKEMVSTSDSTGALGFGFSLTPENKLTLAGGLEGGYRFTTPGGVLIPGGYLDLLALWKPWTIGSLGLSITGGLHWAEGWIPGAKVSVGLDLLAGRRTYIQARGGALWTYQGGLSWTVEIGLRENQPQVRPVPEPRIALGMSQGLFSPDGDGDTDEAVFRLSADPRDKLKAWVLEIRDPGDRLVFVRQGEGVPPETITWDGRIEDKLAVESATDYLVSFQITDLTGRQRSVSDSLATDILLIKEGEKVRIRIPFIEFAAYTGEFSIADREKIDANNAVIDRLAEFFKRFPDYRFRIVGHGNLLEWRQPAKAAVENRTILKPLSLKRAETVRKALIERGIDPSRMEVEGKGGDEPLVPFGDGENNWKNRRVEFILLKTLPAAPARR